MSREPDQLELLYRSHAPRRNADAVERTIRALRQADRLDAVDAGLLAAARTLARALDHASSPYVAGTVARVHLEALRLLAGRPAPEADEFGDLLAAIRRTPTVRHPENS